MNGKHDVNVSIPLTGPRERETQGGKKQAFEKGLTVTSMLNVEDYCRSLSAFFTVVGK